MNSQPSTSLPVALTIAGSDSSAGAGLQADLKTFSAFNVYALTAVTCIVAETPGRVSRIEPVQPDTVREQIRILHANFPVAALKTGLLCSSDIVSVVAQTIREQEKRIPLVVDPVMIATGGDQLLPPEAVARYENDLFPLATLLTPNLDEAATLLGRKIADQSSMEDAARALGAKYGVAVLLKGGHLTGDVAIDLLFQEGEITEFTAPFVRGVATHGTGCTYSAAITAGLAAGRSLEESITRAKEYVTQAIREHFEWKTESGNKIQALNHGKAM